MTKYSRNASEELNGNDKAESTSPQYTNSINGGKNR